MRFNIILAVALLLTIFSTIFFTVSYFFKSNLIEKNISLFFNDDISQRVQFESTYLSDFSKILIIKIDGANIGKIFFSFSLDNFIIRVDFEIFRIDTDFFKELKGIGAISSKGYINISFTGIDLYAKARTKKDFIHLNYKKIFYKTESYLNIFDGFISKKSLNNFSNSDFDYERIVFKGDLKVFNKNIDGDLDIFIKDINIKGTLSKKKDSIFFKGFSKELDGYIKYIKDNEKENIFFKEILVENIAELLNINTYFYGSGDILLNLLEDRLEFKGRFNEVIIDNYEIISNITDIFDLEANQNLFEKLFIQGNINNNLITFDLKSSFKNIEFIVENGNYEIEDKQLYIYSSLYKNSEFISNISYNSKMSALIITPVNLGIPLFKSYIEINSQESDYAKEINSIINLY